MAGNVRAFERPLGEGLSLPVLLNEFEEDQTARN